jgi:hypothetical protein
VDQLGDHLGVPFDPEHLQFLPTHEHGHIRCLLAGHGQLVHDLQLHILGHTIAPQPGSVDPRRLAFQDLDIRSSHDLPVEVRQHPGMFRVLQHRIDAPHPVARAPGVVRGHDGFEQRAPVHRALVIIGIDHRQTGIAPGLLHPQLQLGLVGVQAHSGGSVGTANATLADFQPIVTLEGVGLDQLQSRSGLGGCRGRRRRNGIRMNRG